MTLGPTAICCVSPSRSHVGLHIHSRTALIGALMETEPQVGSPLKSVFAVVVGFIVSWILGYLYMAVIYSLATPQFPTEERATSLGLLLLLAGAVPNGIVAGLLVGRLAGVAPVAHAAVLGGLIGFIGMMSSDDAQGMPFWFALGRIALLPLFIVVGGFVAKTTRPASKKNS